MVLLGLALGPGWFFLKTSRPQQFQLFSDRPGGRSAGGPPWKFRAGYSRATEPSGPVPAGLGPDRIPIGTDQTRTGFASPRRPSQAGPGRAEASRAGPEPSRAGPSRARAGPGPGRAGPGPGRVHGPPRADPGQTGQIRAETYQTESSRAEPDATNTRLFSKTSVSTMKSVVLHLL